MMSDLGKIMAGELENRQQEKQEVAFQMFAEGGHSAKEIAEAMGTTSLSEVSVLLEKFNEQQISKGKPPVTLGAGKSKKTTKANPPAVPAGEPSTPVVTDPDDRALLDQIALQALTIAVADCDDGIRAGQIWRRALRTIDAWLSRMLPEIRRTPDAVQPWAAIAASIALAEVQEADNE